MRKTAAALLMALLLILLAACGSAPAKNVDLPALMTKLPLAQEDRDEMMELDAADLMTYYGIAEADVKQFAALMHTSGIDCDEIVLIEAADSAAAGRVKTALEARLEIKKNEMRDYLPDEYAVIAKCGVRQDGTLVAMIVCPDEKEISGAYQEGIR